MLSCHKPLLQLSTDPHAIAGKVRRYPFGDKLTIVLAISTWERQDCFLLSSAFIRAWNRSFQSRIVTFT